uniref:Cdc42 effector-like domain-containing protein n=1 Tax=Knipowitschia caucasica TaxID=637954 RepID=A0AAV2MCH6_KNICA
MTHRVQGKTTQQILNNATSQDFNSSPPAGSDHDLRSSRPSTAETESSEISPSLVENTSNANHVNADHVDTNEALHSESVSSFTLDLDLDLGPSMLGDVLGVMDGLGMEEVFSPTSNLSPVEIKQANGAMERSVDLKNELNGKKLLDVDENGVEGDSRIPDGNSFKPKSLRPKVRFSDKRDEIIRQASEEEGGQGFYFQDEDEMECLSPMVGDSKRESGVVMGAQNTEVKLPPSPASSHSSEYEVVTALDRRKVDICHSETDSEEEEEGKGYTFEDEFDDEIGL